MERIFTNPLFYSFGLILILFLGYFAFLSAPSSFQPGMIFKIEQGKSLRSLSFKLKQAHVIRSRIAFEAFVIVYDGEKHIAPGDYLFEDTVPVFIVAKRISKGEHHLSQVEVTIPEGFNNTDIANAFAPRLANFNQSNFFKKTEEKEGYLFPDTYFFLATDTEDNVITLMSDNFEKKIAPLRPVILSSGKTEKEIITMASIIEREAKGDADRAVISGILWKRIAEGMPLQVDAAPVTYKEKGLPSSPVCNPGFEAIKAALYPEVSAYLFYLHDNNGNIHYARNFEEHKANKLKYLK